MSKVKSFFRLSVSDRLLVAESFVLLGLARAAVIVVPFRWLASVLGHKKNAVSVESEPEILPTPKMRRIAWAVKYVGRHTLWQSNCLAQAVAGRLMLKRRRISSTIYFGMIKDSDGEITAHAWLKSGKLILTGGDDLEGYVIVAAFSD